ncbi:AI-2E family transporter [Vitiosangium sp. GDMCC 1.1324]|uniref:AI-2E family transporter n=1 Tax=Vitiosangium sp. (strain GDMCC 1.1324) TaxID=2138576 RepID=UPI000D369409|nr:AI-2E family transporter [Vitiosangium sp. GDMCC 1.1324]PTL85556.1 AI-2E family transporter [Vitiosangium sp. GDMCC 1.1324]
MDTARRSQITPRTVWTVGINALALALLAVMIVQLRNVFVLLAVVMLVALALDPLVGWFQRRGLPRVVSVLGSFLGLLGIAVLLGATLVPLVVQQASSLIHAAPNLVAQVRAWEWTRWLEQRFDLEQKVQDALAHLPDEVAHSLPSVVSTTVNTVVLLITVLTLSLFALLFGKDLYEQALSWVRPSHRPRVRQLVVNMRKAVSGYLAGTFLTVTLGGMMTALGTFLLGVPYFLALGSLYLVLGLIPYIGSFLMALLVAFTTLTTVGLKRAVIALALFLIYQQVEGNLIQPLVQRHSIRMNPLIISVVIIMGASLMGLIGAVIALPVAAALQEYLREVQEEQRLRWGSELEVGPPSGESTIIREPDAHDSRDTTGPTSH